MSDRIPQLRPATDADANLCYDIKKKAFGGYIDEVWGWDEAIQRRLHDTDFDHRKFRIAEIDGQTIGLLSIRAEGGSLWVSQIYILPIHQNKGYGTRIIREVISEADEAGKSVKLQVLKINPAKKLYDRLGFLVTGTNGPHHVMERPISESARTNVVERHP